MIEIPLTRGQVVIVDDEDADLGNLNWYAQFLPHYRNGGAFIASRVITTSNSKRISELMHRVILSRMLGRPLLRTEQVDHIWGLTLDNRRSELRLATGSQNQANQGLQKNNTSGFKGVSWCKNSHKWGAQVRIYGKVKHLGYFNTPEDAAITYNHAALEYYGEYARCNEIPDWQNRHPEKTSDVKVGVSGFRGVIHHKNRKRRWQAKIRVNGKYVSLGYYLTPEEAYARYCEEAKKYRGEFANLG